MFRFGCRRLGGLANPHFIAVSLGGVVMFEKTMVAGVATLGALDPNVLEWLL